jgi:formylmethanofuran dehydrogenase subunit B
VSIDDAIAAAVALLAESRAPLICGLGCDQQGAAAAVALAWRIGAVLDHGAADGLLRDLDAMRAGGWIGTTPPVAHAIADTALLIGPAAAEAPSATSRRVLHLCPGRGARGADVLAGGTEQVAVTLGLLRAVVAGRPVVLPPARAAAFARFAAAMKAAKYGVACWSAAGLDALSVEMAVGLIADLNATTRWAALPVPAAANGQGVTLATAALCGFPPRTGFAGDAPVHDPWRFDAARLIASGEADLLVWIDAFGTLDPPDAAGLPTIALVAEPMAASVRFHVGTPGRDHRAVLFDARLGALSAVEAEDSAPPVADILDRLTEALPC